MKRPEATVRLDGLTYSVIDTETTGFSTRNGDRVVELGIARLEPDGTVSDRYQTLLDPGRDVGATHVHGIRNSDVRGAPSFGDVAGDVLQRLEGTVLVGHNLPFDRRFLVHELELLGVEEPQLPEICTLRWAKRLLPDLPTHRLEVCCAHLGVELTDAHSALADAEATALVLVELLVLVRARGHDSIPTPTQVRVPHLPALRTRTAPRRR